MGSGTSRRRVAEGRRIAVAVDRSPEAMVAFLWLRANVLRREDAVVFLHVQDSKSGDEESAQKTLAPFEEVCSAHAIQHQVVKMHGAHSKIAQVIVNAANGVVHADLIVVGCRALSSLKRALVGSVSAKVAASSACPVMVVKKPRSEAGAFLTVLPRRVCIHIDGTKHSEAAFQWAINHMLNPDVDEVFLLCCRLRSSRAFSWLTSSARAKACEQLVQSAGACEQLCIKRGFNVIRIDVASGPSRFSASVGDSRPQRVPFASSSFSTTSSSTAAAAPNLVQALPDELIHASLNENCDLLVVSRECKGCTMLQHAPFPIVVFGGRGECTQKDETSQEPSTWDHSQPPSRRFSSEMDLSQEIGENSDACDDGDTDDDDDGVRAAMNVYGEVHAYDAGRDDENWRRREEEQHRVYRMYQARVEANPVSVSG